MTKENVTNWFKDSNAMVQFVPTAYRNAYCCLGVLITISSFLTICTLYKCRKLTNQIRLMSMHLTFANLIYGITVVGNFLYFKASGKICSLTVKVIPMSFIIYNIFLTATGVDRLLSLRFPLKYILWQRKRNSRILIVSSYVVAICLNVPNMATPSVFSCSFDADMFTYSGLLAFVSSGLFLITCDAIIYFYIGVLAIKANLSNQKHKVLPGTLNDYSRIWLSILKCFIQCVATVVLLGPFLVSRAVDLWYYETSNYTDTSLYAGMFYILHQIFSPIFILLSYKESRFRVALLCCCCCKKRRQTVMYNYKQHYASFTISQGGDSMDTRM